jgi:hypothetical protein
MRATHIRLHIRISNSKFLSVMDPSFSTRGVAKAERGGFPSFPPFIAGLQLTHCAVSVVYIGCVGSDTFPYSSYLVDNLSVPSSSTCVHLIHAHAQIGKLRKDRVEPTIE